MRSFLLAAKLALFFALVTALLLGGVMLLFHRTAGHDALSHEDLLRVHRTFMGGATQLGLVSLACIVGLALYLTGPLRRMSRSMDRIAAGELEHRVAARGGDEVAAMGRSFNAMADRIHALFTGQKELMAGVSHELRSPLARMKLSLELLRADAHNAGHAVDERLDRRITEIESEADTMDELVEELLLVSRFDLGAVAVTLEPVGLEELVQAAWRRVDTEAAERHVRLVLDPGSGTTRLLADRTLAVRALGNLFENAVRYAAPGTVRVSAKRFESGAGNRVEITVADDGPGVAPEQLELLDRLFEPFFRADRSRSRRTGANGLGLMIVRRAVEAQGGAVRAELGSPRGLAIRFDLAAG